MNDNITFEKAEEIQIKYRNLLKRKERKSKYKSLKNISLLAGVDISYYSKNNIEWGIACVVLWDLKKNIMVNTSYAHDEVKFPYKPGFLGFRESKLISIAIKNASKSPELIICDGHGINHPKRFGEATQLGLALNIPSFGVAKNPFFGYS
ncbi:MAG: endonuclease V, partial [Candidatus Hodarchaeota archaeon]